MFFLIIDTRTDEGLLILADETHILDKQNIKNVSKVLVFEISHLLSRNNLSIKDLSFIAINQGPGSFTALRAGLTVGKTLSYTCNIPLICYPAYLVYLTKKQKDTAIIFDAKARGIYYFTNESYKLLNKKSLDRKRSKILLSPDVETLKAQNLKKKLHFCKSDPKVLYALTLKLFKQRKLRKKNHIQLLY